MRKKILAALTSILLSLSPALAANQAPIQVPTTGPMTATTFTSVFLNPALIALGTCNWGITAPANGIGSVVNFGQCWIDTSASPADVIKIYDGVQFVSLGTLDTSVHSWKPNSSITIGSTNIALGTSSLTLAGLTSITSPLYIGNITVAGVLELRATSGAGAGSELVKVTGGNNGATEFARFAGTGTASRFGLNNNNPLSAFDMIGASTDPFIDQYRASMVVRVQNGLGSSGMAFFNTGAAGIGTQSVIQNVLNRTTGGATTASALVTTAQDVGNATFAADLALQTSVNATLGTRIYVSKSGGACIGCTSNVALNNLQGAGSILSTAATAGLGYATGAGGAVTQITSRSTGVTLNTVSGDLTLVSAAGSTTANSFTVTNSAVAVTDTISLSQKSGTDKYNLLVTNVASGSFQITFFTTGGTTTEQPVFHFNVIKGVNN